MFIRVSEGGRVAPQGFTHSFIPTADHCSLQCFETISCVWGMITHHTQTHSLITIHQVTKILAGGGNRDPLLIPQLMKSALNPEIRLPILTIRYLK